MKKLLFVLATVVLLTTATMPSFADGDPGPRKNSIPTCPITGCKTPA